MREHICDKRSGREPPRDEREPRIHVGAVGGGLRWILEGVLDRPLDEREAFLAEACGDDTELLRTVRRLAELSRRSEDERMGPGAGLLLAAFSPAPGTRPGNPEALVGTSVGPYRLGRVLGVGGLGAVYLGERVDGAFERQVAIKVLWRELDAHGVMERFRLERRIWPG